jgi:uncharacterized protein YhaN
MILLEAIVDGFGCLVNQRFKFGEGLTVIAGPNESGKTTLTECIVRLLFGYPEHQYMSALDFRRPWRSPAYAASLIYRTDDGTVYETRRDFSQSNVPTETFERDVMRRLPELSGSRKTSPGEALLHLSKEAFEAAAVMRAGEFATDRSDAKSYHALAERIAELVGAAGEAGAQEAIDRLKTFADTLGSDRAPTRPVNAARAQSEAARAALDAYRRDCEQMRDNIARRTDLLQKQSQLASQVRELERHLRDARLHSLRARIAAAERASEELERLSSSRERGGAPPEVLARAASIDAAIDAWTAAHTAENDATSSSQVKEEQRSDLLRQLAECDAALKKAEATIASRSEAIERLKPESASAPISDETLERLEKLSELADVQEGAARTTETQAAINRQRPRAGAWPAIFVFAIALIALIIGAIAHLPSVILSAVAGVLASGVMFAYFFVAERNRSAANAALEERAQQARAVADSATSNLAKECATLGLADIRAVRRAAKTQPEIRRFTEALADARQMAAQSHELRDSLEARFNEFDRLDRQLVDARRATEESDRTLQRLLDEAGVAGDDLAARIAAFREARQGVEGALLTEKALGEARATRASALASDTLGALQRQAADLVQGGAVDAAGGDPAALERQLKELADNQMRVEGELGRVQGELTRFDEQHHGGSARLEEQLAACQANEERLVRARDAAVLARDVIEKTKDGVHKDFAPHLNALAGPALADITHGRYTSVLIDPRDFSLRVQAAGDTATRAMGELSAGTQEQLHLSLRAATAQALGYGDADEHVPLLLDDALAHADERRLAAAVRHLASIAQRQQILLFAQRDTVLEAARKIEGVTIVHLSGPAAPSA